MSRLDFLDGVWSVSLRCFGLGQQWTLDMAVYIALASS